MKITDTLPQTADAAFDKATEIAAAGILIWQCGQGGKDFYREIELKRGKTPIAKFTNYIVDGLSANLYQFIKPFRAEIAGTIEVLQDWQHDPFPEDNDIALVVAEINRRGGMRELKRQSLKKQMEAALARKD
jgi:hypothetical protein